MSLSICISSKFIRGCAQGLYRSNRNRHFGLRSQYSSNLLAAQLSTSCAGYSQQKGRSLKTTGENVVFKKEDTPAAIGALRCLMTVYDAMTLPIYTLMRKSVENFSVPYATKFKVEGKNEWRSTLPKCNLTLEMEQNNIDTLEKLFSYSVTKYGNKKCLGSRPVISQDDGIGLLRKRELGDYQWKTYNDMNDLTENLSLNMRHALGLKERETIAIFADTREEWLMTAFAAFKANLAVATIFTALSDEGVVHAANETEASCLFTSDDLLPKCGDLISQMPRIKTIIYMDKPGTPLNLPKTLSPVKIQPLSKLFKFKPESKMSESEAGTKPGPQDTAIIMYTSGSSGNPKGVILSHHNAISGLKGTADSLDTFHAHHRISRAKKNNYLAYLPVAHIFELTAEALSLFDACEIGFGTPTTLTDVSPGLLNGSKGDATLLKPTNIIVVPLVLERLTKAIQTKIKERGGIFPHLMDLFCDYKVRWRQRGHPTPLLDKFFFSKINVLLGGELRLMICGGAPLAPQTHEFVRTVFCDHLNSGYGLTETSGCISSNVAGDHLLGRAGSPTNGAIFRLVDWEDGGYRSDDKPFPRGEIIIGGENVAMGYFKRPENEDIFVEQGVRYMRTGDVVEIQDDGVIKIIDRKKNIVKLSSGEFLSLGKIESILKLCPLVENIFVYANPLLPNAVAIVVPAEAEVKHLAKTLGKLDNSSFIELLEDLEFVQNCLLKIQEHAKAMKLSRHETPREIYMTPELWTPQNGLVTASLKLKRTNIQAKFQDQLDHLCSRIPKA